MARTLLIAVAGVVAVMAALILLPGVSRQGGTVSIEYHRDVIIRMDSGLYDVSGRQTLTISNDGSARYLGTGSQGEQQSERRFSVSGDEMKVLRELFLNTGFMQIPRTDYEEKSGLANFTRYELAVRSVEESQLIHWVNPEASNESVPSIIINAGSRLDAIIKRHS
ncbi:MAG: hypothetical protein ACRD99_05500 [Nitrososphaera sp.]